MGNRYQHTFSDFLTFQRFASSTKELYIRSIKGLADFHSQPPDKLSNKQIQEYLVFCIQEKKLSWSSCNILFCGIKKYYLGYLGRKEIDVTIPPRTRAKKIPMLLSREEVYQLLNTPASLKHRALLTTVYSAGLRVSEVVRLRPEHIESSHMAIRVEQAKGRKDRYTVLSRHCLGLLRNYWRVHHPRDWLFFGKNKNRPMPVGTAQHIFYNAKKKSGITKGRGIHTLRHCFASHAMDDGVEMYIIKRWMGHTSIKTTYNYIHVCSGYLEKIGNPLDRLYAGRQS
jgi:site-specific recombinase XerD